MEIRLTKGQVTQIDDVDADLGAYKWHASKKGKTFYARRNVQRSDGSRTTVYLHQEIARGMGIVGDPDHIDRDGLNNRRDNLRPDPNGRNMANRDRFANNTSGYKGVYPNKRLGKWVSQITVDGKQLYLGIFVDKIKAAIAYDRAAIERFGEFAVLNFPEQQTDTSGATQ
jgi:hypothetical protein